MEHKEEKAKQDAFAVSCPACLIRMKGIYVDEVNWMTGKGTHIDTVESKIEDQGECSVCWAWVTGKASHAAFKGAKHDVDPFSIQDIADHTYPGVKGCKGGNSMAALQFVKTEGVSLEAEYYTCFTGFKPPETPPRHTGVKHRIDDWFLVKDTEEAMLAAARKQVLIVTIPCYSGVVLLKGEGLLDLIQAERDHDQRLLKKYYKGKDVPNAHSLLLVGFGEFIPEDSTLTPTKYWILKNQWDDVWGDKGLVRVIRNSSLMEIHRHGLRSSRHTAEYLQRLFNPMFPYVCDHQNPLEAYLPRDEDNKVIVSNIMKDKTASELLEIICQAKYNQKTLFVVLYDPEHCQKKGINVEEVVVALEKSFQHELDKLVAMVDLSVQPQMQSTFGLQKKDKLVLLVFLPVSVGRSVKDARQFPNRKFNIGNILLWLGNKLQLAPYPSPGYDGSSGST